jgi:peptide/nickel transport system permease protein
MAGSIPVSATASPAARPHVGPWQEAWRRFRKHRLAVVSAVVLVVLILGVLLGPLYWSVPIDDIDFSAMLQGPSLAHPLGTDDLGQDLLARILYGGRISLAVGFTAMLVAVGLGMFIVGSTAGMAGAADRRRADVADRPVPVSLPQLPLLLLIIYLFRDR